MTTFGAWVFTALQERDPVAIAKARAPKITNAKPVGHVIRREPSVAILWGSMTRRLLKFPFARQTRDSRVIAMGEQRFDEPNLSFRNTAP